MALTHLKGLSITPDPRGGTALQVTGTTAWTGSPSITGALTVTGTTVLSGKVTATGSGKTITIGDLHIPSAANAVSGIASIAAAGNGTATVSTTKVRSSSRILLNAVVVTPLARNGTAFVSTIASGTSFKVRLGRTQTAGTVATASGRVSWLIVNL